MTDVEVTESERWWMIGSKHAGSNDHRTTLAWLLNTLLGLGQVRPWVTWSDSARGRKHLQIKYSSRSLLSNLALQLCLRVSKMEAFLVCVHCQTVYAPLVRAPKTGQRNFCPKCRRNGIPNKYALKDFRRKRRSENAERAG
jgi:hypothetical protein